MTDTELKELAERILKHCEKIRVDIQEITGTPNVVTTGPPANGFAIGLASTATADGIALGPRIHAGLGQVIIDTLWLQQIINSQTNPYADADCISCGGSGRTACSCLKHY